MKKAAGIGWVCFASVCAGVVLGALAVTMYYERFDVDTDECADEDESVPSVPVLASVDTGTQDAG